SLFGRVPAMGRGLDDGQYAVPLVPKNVNCCQPKETKQDQQPASPLPGPLSPPSPTRCALAVRPGAFGRLVSMPSVPVTWAGYQRRFLARACRNSIDRKHFRAQLNSGPVQSKQHESRDAIKKGPL
ncbi:hypothetical protein T310_8790, partial [Rasamsonia emersonii CBS 393.64]